MTDIIIESGGIRLMYLIVINALAFVTFGYDKYQAVKGRWRVPEKTLFLLAIIGGSVGAMAGMRVFRHKTKHNSFVFGLPVIFAVQCVVFSYFSL